MVPMALYKHVADKEDLLDGMVEVLIREIDPPAHGTDWRIAIRQRVLSARRALQRHPWARQAIESRVHPTPAVLAYQDSFAGIFLAGGFTPTSPTTSCMRWGAGCGGSPRNSSTGRLPQRRKHRPR